MAALLAYFPMRKTLRVWHIRLPTYAATKLNDALKTGFPPFVDEHSLRFVIESVCAKFGSMKSLCILPATGDAAGTSR